MIIQRRSQARRTRAGVTLIELAVAIPLVLLALGMFTGMLSAGIRLRADNREAARAEFAALEAIENMRNAAFSSLVTLYDPEPFNDPAGPGTAPGDRFEVEGLEPPAPGAPIGAVRLPLVDTGTALEPRWELREDVVVPELGMPRDLNGDLVVDREDHREDYTILPVQIELVWRGGSGERRYELCTLLTRTN